MVMMSNNIYELENAVSSLKEAMIAKSWLEEYGKVFVEEMSNNNNPIILNTFAATSVNGWDAAKDYLKFHLRTYAENALVDSLKDCEQRIKRSYETFAKYGKENQNEVQD